jgi:hypothetical protein
MWAGRSAARGEIAIDHFCLLRLPNKSQQPLTTYAHDGQIVSPRLTRIRCCLTFPSRTSGSQTLRTWQTSSRRWWTSPQANARQELPRRCPAPPWLSRTWAGGHLKKAPSVVSASHKGPSSCLDWAASSWLAAGKERSSEPSVLVAAWSSWVPRRWCSGCYRYRWARMRWRHNP